MLELFELDDDADDELELLDDELLLLEFESESESLLELLEFELESLLESGSESLELLESELLEESLFFLVFFLTGSLEFPSSFSLVFSFIFLSNITVLESRCKYFRLFLHSKV